MKGTYFLPDHPLDPGVIFQPLSHSPELWCKPADAEGEPHVRWRKGELGYQGWWAIGCRKQLSGSKTFWGSVLEVAAELSQTALDTVHVVGPGVLAMGGLSITMRSSYAAALLHECLLTAPEYYVRRMSPLIQKTGAYTWRPAPVESGVVIVDSYGRMLDEEDERHGITGKSDGKKWTTQQKKTAHVWVSTISRLLRDEHMDAAQVAMTELLLPACLTQKTKEAIGWPRSGLSDYWQYTLDQQLCWGVFLLLGLGNPHLTERLAMDTQGDGPALDRLDSIRRALSDAPLWHRSRFTSARALLGERLGLPPDP